MRTREPARKRPLAGSGGQAGLRARLRPVPRQPGARHVCGNESFRYVRELTGRRDAALEFEVEIDGIEVNGVDMITWNDDGRIVEFKVFVRPLKAINLVHQKMAAMLQASR